MNMTSSRPYMARALYDWILDNDCTPYILVDANQEGVAVPMEYVKDGQIVLNVSPSAVRALDIGNDILIFDGRFGGQALTICVPFEALMAIYARENGQGMVFEVEAAPIMEGEASDAVEASPAPEAPQPPRTGRPSLKVVK